MYVEGDIPYNFMYTDISGEKYAYLVSLDYINCDDMTTGRDYKRFEEDGNNIETVKFGVDDVYVYDANGTVFYAKGFEYQAATYHTQINTGKNIKIIDVEKEIDNTKAKIIVTIKSDQKVDYILVKKGNYEIRNDADKGPGTVTYEVELEQNGEYDIIVRDMDNNQDKEKVTIRGIGTESAPVVTAEVTNGIEIDDVYQVTGDTANIKIYSNTAKYLYIGNTNAEPTSWLPFAEDIEKIYTSGGEKTLYIWVKDENDIVCNSPFVLKININLGDVDKPIPPLENLSGDIEIEVIDSAVWKRSKKVIIKFSNDRQENGYQSLYRINSNSGLSSNGGRWIVSYENIVEVDVTKNNSDVEAKIIYNSPYKEQLVNEGSVTVTKIDTKPPTLTSLKVNKAADGKTSIIGIATDGNNSTDSGIHSTASYLLSTQQINFKYLTDDAINDFEWQANNSFEIIRDAKYYFYVRDNANNVGYGSINAEAADNEAPEILSANLIRIEDYANIEIIAKDNVGIAGFAVIKGTASAIPSKWEMIEEATPVTVYKENIKEEGVYTAWVRDASGNTASKTVEVTVNKLPVLDTNLPKNLYIAEGNNGIFEVAYITNGDPNEYQYQWKVSKDNGATWENINGATGNKYTFIADYNNNNNLYKCEIKHVAGTIETGSAKLEVARITKNSPEVIITEDKEMIAGGVIINKGAIDTTDPNLTIDIIAINAEQVSISETQTKGNWQSYDENNTEFTYRLNDTDNGIKTINVWIKDSKGNEQKMTAQIELGGR